MKFDYEVSPQEVQELANADALTAFFAKLGYQTDSRTTQAPSNLGITANGTLKAVKRIELLADQEEGLLQVYLIEVSSVTIAHTKSLCRTFRNRAGNFLLVLTSDYETLDFVLLEKYIPAAQKSTKAINLSQVNVRPRTLTVNRKKPETVHLRVLRRFTYTESDPFAQYDKLLCAYAIADWSEEYFNNRALFSDHYLTKRLRERAEWKEDPKPTYQALRELYGSASTRFANQSEDSVRGGLYEPLFAKLGFEFKTGKKSSSSDHEPDYYLRTRGSTDTVAVCLTYSWGRSLDSKDDQRDQETPEENPGAVVVSLLEKELASWAIVTNGRCWRLYSQKTHSRATNYYEVDLEEILAQGGPLANDPSEAFRFFWLLFRAEAFIPKLVQRDGSEQELCFLDELLADSEAYAKELGDRLKNRVFEDIFPHLAEGFIKFIRSREGKDAELSQGRLDQIFTGTLMLLYRLLFLLYAESRDLLPIKEVRGYFEASLEKIKREIAGCAGTIEDEVEKQLKRHYTDHEFALSDRLLRLFEIIDRGDVELNVPVYNGGLFITNPDSDDITDDAQNARFLHDHKVPDRFLARAIDLLARDIDTKRHDLAFIDYKSLGVRQLGSIYEGLLEFKLRIAPKKMAIVKGTKTEEIVPYEEAVKKGLKILTSGRGRDASERTLPKGAVYLENDKRERKATGSYYTPDYIVDYIVQHTVGPVLEEKFEVLRPKLRHIQKERQEFFKKQDALKKKDIRPEPDSVADLIGQELVKDVFDIKVLDPAMGSGHFLVEVVDFVTDKTIDFLNAFPWNPVSVYLNQMRETILAEMDEQGISIDRSRLTDVNLLKRHVLKRCVYGVDINPMAVELAKVSLWLDCFTLGAPLSFLDHHFRCGNSLVGITVEEVKTAIEASGQTSLLFASDRFAGLMRATDWMRHVGELSDVTNSQVKQSRSEYRQAFTALMPFKRTLDIYVSRWFGNSPTKQIVRKKGKLGARLTEVRDVTVEVICSSDIDHALNTEVQHKELSVGMLSPDDRNIVCTAFTAASRHNFFHWELEFPEVFYEGGTAKVHGGFDAVVGNPPWGADLHADSDHLEDRYALASGQYDSYELFIEAGFRSVKQDGTLGMIIPDSILKPEHEPLRDFLGKKSIVAMHRMGEGLFADVYRASIVFVCQQSTALPANEYQSLSINKDHRSLLESGAVTLSDLAKQIGGKRKISAGWQDGHFAILIGLKDVGETVISQMIAHKVEWDAICDDYRGAEFSQTGFVLECKECHTYNIPPRKRKGQFAEKACTKCGLKLAVSEETTRHVVADTAQGLVKPRAFIRGEDVNRYAMRSTSYVDTSIDTINFKDSNIYTPPKILVRKTGLGIYASIDYADSIVPQAVYIFRKKDTSEPYALEYILGVLNSRLALYYYLKKSGESEWKSFPYITQRVVKDIPLPYVDWKDRMSVQLHNRIVELVRKMLKRPDVETDMLIEKEVWAAFKLSFDDLYYEITEFLTQKVQALRIIRELFPQCGSPAGSTRAQCPDK